MKSQIIALAAALLAAAPAMAAPHEGNAFLHDYDTNHDGQVPRDEFDLARVQRLQATDANKDGWVSEAEYVGEYSARLERQLAASSRTEDSKTEERQRQIRQAHVRFGILDHDKDQKLTQAEFDVSGARAFAEHDQDKDGTVTQADVTAEAAKRVQQSGS